MTEATDYYELLGVAETASPAEVKRAFRARARETHPDHHPEDPAAADRFKALQRAYHVLCDTRRRRAYDDARRLAFGSGGWPGAGRDAFDPLASLFFGADVPSGRTLDVEAQVRLTFDQALRGGATEVRVGNEPVRLTIPKGVRSGLKVRLKGRGRLGAGGHRGDLYVTFRAEADQRFRREGDNLHVVETVSAIEATLGTVRSITSAYGQSLKVTIPPGTQPGERLRLRGQGVETATRRGDLFVEVQVTVPRALTDAQRAALGATAREIGLL